MEGSQGVSCALSQKEILTHRMEFADLCFYVITPKLSLVARSRGSLRVYGLQYSVQRCMLGGEITQVYK